MLLSKNFSVPYTVTYTEYVQACWAKFVFENTIKEMIIFFNEQVVRV